MEKQLESQTGATVCVGVCVCVCVCVCFDMVR